MVESGITLTDVSLKKFKVDAPWKSHHFSMASRLTRSLTKLQAATSAIPIYTMQSVKLLKSIYSRLDKFLMCHDEEKEEKSYS